MIRISLHSNPRHCSIRVGDTLHELATWHRAGDGLMLATTTDGQRVTLATEEPDEHGHIAGALCIGNTVRAPRWAIHRATKAGAVLTGQAHLVPDDWEMATLFPGCGWKGAP
jgi:Lon protease-like protein